MCVLSTHIMHSLSLQTIDTSHLCNAGTEDVGFSPTREALFRGGGEICTHYDMANITAPFKGRVFLLREWFRFLRSELKSGKSDRPCQSEFQELYVTLRAHRNMLYRATSLVMKRKR